jgi:hypothetical protein
MMKALRKGEQEQNTAGICPLDAGRNGRCLLCLREDDPLKMEMSLHSRENSASSTQ